MSNEQIIHTRHRIRELTGDIVLSERMELWEYAELCRDLQTNLLEELMELSEQVCLISV